MEGKRSEDNDGNLQIVIKLYGSKIVEKLDDYIDKNVMKLKEKYPYTDIRIEVDT